MGYYDALLQSLPAAGSVAGDIIGANANSDAAKTVSNAWLNSVPVYSGFQQQARDSYGAGVTSAEGKLDAGLAERKGLFQPEIAAGQPAVSYLRGVMAQNPYQLTPQQQQAKTDMQLGENNGLATSGLRGSGRAVASVFNDTAARFDANAADSNMRRADSAGGALSNLYSQGTQGAANAVADTSDRAAQMEQQKGGVNATSFANTGSYAAQAPINAAEATAAGTTANGQLAGDALGTIGSAASQALKAFRNSGGGSSGSDTSGGGGSTDASGGEAAARGGYMGAPMSGRRRPLSMVA